MISKKDEQEMKEAVEESGKGITIQANISDEHKLQTVPVNQLAAQREVRGMDIEGMEDVPMSIMRPPYVRLVQLTSKKTENEKGKEAQPGNFLFSDTKKEVSQLNFVLLRLKHEMKPVDESGQFIFEEGAVIAGSKPQISALGYDPKEEKIFILSLSVSSFSSLGTLYSQFKAIHCDKTWRFNLTVTSERVENKKGKFYIAKFQIGNELEASEVEQMGQRAYTYGVVLDKQFTEDETV